MSSFRTINLLPLANLIPNDLLCANIARWLPWQCPSTLARSFACRGTPQSQSWVVQQQEHYPPPTPQYAPPPPSPPPEAWTPQVLQLQNSPQCLYQQLLPPTPSSSCVFARQGFYRPQFPIDRNHLQKQQSRHYFLWMNNQDDVNNLFPHPTLGTCCLRGGHICSGIRQHRVFARPIICHHTIRRQRRATGYQPSHFQLPREREDDINMLRCWKIVVNSNHRHQCVRCWCIVSTSTREGGVGVCVWHRYHHCHCSSPSL